jgi:hypothetical protein
MTALLGGEFPTASNETTTLIVPVSGGFVASGFS